MPRGHCWYLHVWVAFSERCRHDPGREQLQGGHGSCCRTLASKLSATADGAALRASSRS